MHPKPSLGRRPGAALLATLLALGPAAAQDTTPVPAPDPAPEAAPETGAAPENTAPQADAFPEPADVDPGRVLATVGDTEITLGHVIVARRTLPEQFQQLPDEMLLPGLVDQLVQQTLLADALAEEPPSIGFQIDNEARNLRAAEALREHLSGAVSEEDVRAAYEARVAEVEPETEYRASHILLESEEDARAVLDELDGGADFADLARARSTGPSGPRGGDLGFFGPGMMVEPFQQAVEALEPGEVSEPVQTQFGFHVIRLEETRQSEVPPFETLAPEIAQELQRGAVQAHLADLQAGAEVTREPLEGIDPAVLSGATLE